MDGQYPSLTSTIILTALQTRDSAGEGAVEGARAWGGGAWARAVSREMEPSR